MPARPRMFVVAGPAGSGKSTVFPLRSFNTDVFNIDDRCAALNGGSWAGILPETRTRVGEECRAFIEEHITSRTSFAVETTLRTTAAIDQAAAASAAGFQTVMFFIATGDVRVNVARITARGLAGGHSSPEAEIRAIFEASMTNLPRAVTVFDTVECFDNTRHAQRPMHILTFRKGVATVHLEPLPSWASAITNPGAAR